MTDIRRPMDSSRIYPPEKHVLETSSRHHHVRPLGRPASSAIWLTVAFFAMVSASYSFPYIISETEALLISPDSRSSHISHARRPRVIFPSSTVARGTFLVASNARRNLSAWPASAGARLERGFIAIMLQTKGRAGERERKREKEMGKRNVLTRYSTVIYFSRFRRNPRDGNRVTLPA